jgi:hypothetical protein
MPFDKWYFVTKIWSKKPFVDGPRNVFGFDCCYFGCDHGPVTAMGAQGVTTVTLWSDSYHQGSSTLSCRGWYFDFSLCDSSRKNPKPCSCSHSSKQGTDCLWLPLPPHELLIPAIVRSFSVSTREENYVRNSLIICFLYRSDQFNECKFSGTYNIIFGNFTGKCYLGDIGANKRTILKYISKN